MSLCDAWKASMICWVTAWELPGLLDQKVISLAGVIFDQSVESDDAAAAAPPPPPPDVLGPPQAASVAAAPKAPARPRKPRRSSAAEVSADGMRAGITGLQVRGCSGVGSERIGLRS